MKRIAVAALAFASAAVVLAGPAQTKWLVLDPIKYQTGVDRIAFEGIDKLLLTKLVQAKKYKCLDRDMYDTAAREEGFGGNAELVPAGYAMSGEIVQFLKSNNILMVVFYNRHLLYNTEYDPPCCSQAQRSETRYHPVYRNHADGAVHIACWNSDSRFCKG